MGPAEASGRLAADDIARPRAGGKTEGGSSGKAFPTQPGGAPKAEKDGTGGGSRYAQAKKP